ncbi:hypothetical protein WR25_15611 [Diploscapter pachys]|uniref:Uncharacterized protein n=1 Tax=Diploscapter pachys TaxID=2018661 RepID=A0A2A2M094_9BILA|nr:hypothetical protein WR25_15611 [Diploscapter pachys]
MYPNGPHQDQSLFSLPNSLLSSPFRRSSSSFPAVELPSKGGKHPIYQFRIPGTDQNGMPTRPLRKKDAERRDAVYREMTSFEQEIAYRAPTKKRVAEYLEEMSCHMSTKRK